MCTYGENAVKEFFNLRRKNWNEIKEQLAKANCSVNKKNTIVIRIQPWGIYNINIF
ncbi:hypothetical protein ADK18_12760 [Bacillus anthracis]|nr:hypothetical protein ADK18_12760 [Bacillus anthracis]KOS27959.1 hypothetical protein ADK17_13935 [Bacillus anthracis]